MKKIKIIALISFLTVMSINVNVVQAAKVITPSAQTSVNQGYVPLTKAEKIEADKKVDQVEKYFAQQKSKNIIQSLATTGTAQKTMYFPYNAEEHTYFCGPASAYNAIKGIYSSALVTQGSLADELGTTTDGTNFSSKWVTSMNVHLPGNNYQLINASDYGNSTTTWAPEAQHCIVWTINKGYPVIADTVQHKGGIKLIPQYSYVDTKESGLPTYHYITITGYDNDGTRTLFSDSNINFPGRYWAYTQNVAAVSMERGFIW